MNATKDEVKAAIQIILTVSSLIKELGQVPSGELYAMLLEPLPKMSCETYLRMIDKIREAGLIRVDNHLITWIGPK